MTSSTNEAAIEFKSQQLCGCNDRESLTGKGIKLSKYSLLVVCQMNQLELGMGILPGAGVGLILKFWI